MNQPETIRKRLQKVDLLRGFALIGMVIYHFSWDLSYFSYITPEIPAEGILRLLARCIAFCFLFVCGFSLYLAHGKKIRWHAFFRRLFVIVMAACLVSLVSFLVMPQGLIYFGILHEIAVTSVIALLFLHTPVFINLVAIAFFWVTPYFYQSDLFNAPYLLWIGFCASPLPSFDYVPVFPWFSAGLAGLTIARIVDFFHAFQYLERGIRPRWLNSIVGWMGRHSLIFYLIHQPVLLAIIYCFSVVFPPSLATLRTPMERSCVAECQTKQPDSNLCIDFCDCVFNGFETQNLIGAFSKGEIGQTDPRLQTIVNACWRQIVGKLN
ncbi:heparan-alpha-glucosaminide N-acetyltransferase [uncultured Bartonella sp.]|uniref:DUF1624 domain-containing protein n=1 Tax=uncultured Bartonella sp. TaxID=104108 RepID=UPI00261963EA|nr:heparan-alpha-glucosaminide N-acetyltransferase [uncultured Bartonella sp.]